MDAHLSVVRAEGEAAGRLRRVAPMLLPDTARSALDGPKPELRWEKPTDLLIDASYQRDLRPSSVRLIRKIVSEFAWSRIKPPVAVKVGGGYHVIDGQHTAIAAASLGVAEIPIFVVAAPEIIDRAQAFVSHNRNRLAITALDIHRALVAGGDPLAASVQRTLDEVGVRFRYLAKGVKPRVGDTQAIARVIRLFRQRGVARAREVLAVLVAAKCCPIVEPHLTATLAILDDGFKPAEIKMAARVGIDHDVPKARAAATMAGKQAWESLRDIWRKRL